MDPNTEPQPDYSAQIAACLRDVFYEPWMSEEEWEAVIAPFGEMLAPDKINAEVAAGFALGFSFDEQLAALRQELRQIERDYEQQRGRG